MEDGMNAVQQEVAEEAAINVQLAEQECVLLVKIADAEWRLNIIREKRKLEELKKSSLHLWFNINTLQDTLWQKEISIDEENKHLQHVCTICLLYTSDAADE